MLYYDYESTERWMSIIGKRVEHGTTRKETRKDPSIIPRAVLTDLLFCDYLDYLKYLITQMESPNEQTGSFKTFFENNFMTVERGQKRKRNSESHKPKKKKKTTPKNVASVKQKRNANLPLPEPDEVMSEDDENDWMEEPRKEKKNFLKVVAEV